MTNKSPSDFDESIVKPINCGFPGGAEALNAFLSSYFKYELTPENLHDCDEGNPLAFKLFLNFISK